MTERRTVADRFFPMTPPHRTSARAFAFGALALLIVTNPSRAAAPSAWNSPPVHQLNGNAPPLVLPAQSTAVSEAWVRVASLPFMAYIPEKHRVLMLVSLDYPHRPALLHSDDDGATWSDPVYFGRQYSRGDDGEQAYTDGVGLTYLGGGQVTWVGQRRGNFTGQFEYHTTFERWFSHDYGETWDDHSLRIEVKPDLSVAGGRRLKGLSNVWDPILVDKNPQTGVTTLFETKHFNTGDTMSGGSAWAYLMSSTDGARTWSAPMQPPQWAGINEVALCRAANGDMIAACRTDSPERFKRAVDNWQGLGLSISKDNGRTWSPIRKLFDWGRHHPSMVVRANGDIVMSYIVRRGYTNDPAGFPRFGIEAVVSHDHGQTWDLDHRYILAMWSGTIRREGDDLATDQKNDWDWLWSNPQCTSSLLLPDGSILTAFGTGFRMQKVKVGLVLRQPTAMRVPYDIGLVHWRVNDQGLNADRMIADAPFDSDLRNMFDPGKVISLRPPR